MLKILQARLQQYVNCELPDVQAGLKKGRGTRDQIANMKAFFTHAALLDQACAHCPIFPTAASRRSLGRVSVPVWLIILSDQLAIVALVGHYPTNQLIAHRSVQPREVLRSPAFSRRTYAVLVPVSRGYPPRLGRSRCFTHPSATRHPRSKLCCAAVRLACVRHAASVQSEPGSNSSLKLSTTSPSRAWPSIFLKRSSQPIKTHY